MRFAKLPWPLPALLTWGVAWGVCVALRSAAAPVWATLLLPSLVGLAGSIAGGTRWRQLFIALGFPLSWLLLHAATVPAWAWLLPLAVLLLAYPLHAWRDAPLFPTPAGVLQGLAEVVDLPVGARVIDAGCGTGAGLVELHRVLPQAELHGIEWSWPWRWWAGLRCPWARVRRGDMWAMSWSDYQLVYLFQRPESMPRAVEKAQRELASGAWLVSLEFEATQLTPQAVLRNAAGKPVWLYRIA
ncbi:class I SAM-dependent methyltransferase [Aquabacterium sp.]|uniref:class I SAM-dependent methyltransferase n=1 Tax=Aquabacterium sp. TaxID=1872578 RepID=UPI0035B1FF1B